MEILDVFKINKEEENSKVITFIILVKKYSKSFLDHLIQRRIQGRGLVWGLSPSA